MSGTLKAEQIAAAFYSLIQGAAITGVQTVADDNVYAYHDEQLPAINIVMGPDRPVGELGPDNLSFQDWSFTMYADIVIKQPTSVGILRTELNALRLGVHKAVMANYTLGLGFVFNGYPAEVAEPERKGDGEAPVAVMRVAFTFLYRASITDPSQ